MQCKTGLQGFSCVLLTASFIVAALSGCTTTRDTTRRETSPLPAITEQVRERHFATVTKVDGTTVEVLLERERDFETIIRTQVIETPVTITEATDAHTIVATAWGIGLASSVIGAIGAAGSDWEWGAGLFSVGLLSTAVLSAPTMMGWVGAGEEEGAPTTYVEESDPKHSTKRYALSNERASVEVDGFGTVEVESNSEGVFSLPLTAVSPSSLAKEGTPAMVSFASGRWKPIDITNAELRQLVKNIAVARSREAKSIALGDKVDGALVGSSLTGFSQWWRLSVPGHGSVTLDVVGDVVIGEVGRQRGADLYKATRGDGEYSFVGGGGSFLLQALPRRPGQEVTNYTLEATLTELRVTAPVVERDGDELVIDKGGNHGVFKGRKGVLEYKGFEAGRFEVTRVQAERAWLTVTKGKKEAMKKATKLTAKMN